MDRQIAFFEWMKDKNMKYAKDCTHCMGGYCDFKKKCIDMDFICPCEGYEKTKENLLAEELSQKKPLS